MNHVIQPLGRALEQEARSFAQRLASEQAPARSYIVIDFEYAYQKDCHAAYVASEGKGAEPKIRWPFHRIVAASWITVRVKPGSDVPVIEQPVVLSAATNDERGIAQQLFAVLDQEQAVVVTWGGECKDLAVLRRCAAEYGLVLPPQLKDLAPHSPLRLDLCNAVSVRADSVHLPEYAAACSIPAKPAPSKSIGKLVECGNWPAVEEQVLADALTTTVIAVRHLASHGMIASDQARTFVLLADKAMQAMPGARFAAETMKIWARDNLRRSGLRGVIYRAA